MDERIRALAHDLLDSGVETLTDRERRVIAHIAARHHVARNVNTQMDETRSAGQTAADALARWCGSWTFVLGFALFLGVWALVNTILLAPGQRFDPYPFIFLNLVLSMLAAIQAPIIMMSQNRQAERDRVQAGQDYEVNLKAELEILALHEKIDHLTARLTGAAT
jgi:uncharacterized membrane protein